MFSYETDSSPSISRVRISTDPKSFEEFYRVMFVGSPFAVSKLQSSAQDKHVETRNLAGIRTA